MIWDMIQEMTHARKGDLNALRRSVSARRRQNRARQTNVDREQDERIALLEAEVDELRLDLAATLSVLISKGVLEPEECRVIAWPGDEDPEQG